MASIEIRDAEERDIAGVMHIFTESGIDGGKSFHRRGGAGIVRAPPAVAELPAAGGRGGWGDRGTYSLLIMERWEADPAGVVEDVAVLPSRQAGDRTGDDGARALRMPPGGLLQAGPFEQSRRTGAHRFYDSLPERHGFSFVTEF